MMPVAFGTGKHRPWLQSAQASIRQQTRGNSAEVEVGLPPPARQNDEAVGRFKLGREGLRRIHEDPERSLDIASVAEQAVPQCDLTRARALSTTAPNDEGTPGVAYQPIGSA
jgi:hypothetical protein